MKSKSPFFFVLLILLISTISPIYSLGGDQSPKAKGMVDDAVIENTTEKRSDLLSNGKDFKEIKNTSMDFPFKNHYPSKGELYGWYDDVVNNYSNICKKIKYGESWNGNNLTVLKVSDNVEQDEKEPEVLIDGGIHAREWSGPVVASYFLWSILQDYQTNDTIQWLINNREIFVAPMLNPDGYIHDGNGNLNNREMWRKNRNDSTPSDAIGVDLNRNWDIKWDQGSDYAESSTYHGESPFSEYEIGNYSDWILSRDIESYQNIHSYAGTLLLPSNFEDEPYPHEDWLYDMGRDMTSLTSIMGDENNHYSHGTAAEEIGYSAYGAANDWVYYATGAPGLTYEIETDGDGFYPSESKIMTINRDLYDSLVYQARVADTDLGNGTENLFPPAPYLIYGNVRNYHGNLVRSENVTIQNLATGENISTKTDENGYYELNFGNFVDQGYQDNDDFQLKVGATTSEFTIGGEFGQRIDLKAITSDGFVELDHNKYYIEDEVEVGVKDSDLDSNDNPVVNITSETEPSGEVVNLTKRSTGYFTGNITVSGTDGSGSLQVSNKNNVSVLYEDLDVGNGTPQDKTDRAVIDCDPPIVQNITSDSKLSTIISWETDEPAKSKINYGLTSSLRKSVRSEKLDRSHDLSLGELIPNETYYYEIISIDEAGNRVNKNNNSGYYTFKANSFDNVESLNSGWNDESYWQVWNKTAYSGKYAWNFRKEDVSERLDQTLTTPSLDLRLIKNANFSWQHSYDFLKDFDGGIVEVHDGDSWSKVTPDDGYDGELSTYGDNPLGEETVFTGDSEGWTNETIDLAPYLPAKTIRIRFRVGTNIYESYDNWTIDDLNLSYTLKDAPYIEDKTIKEVTPGENFTFNASVLDHNGISNVTINWDTDNSTPVSMDMNYTDFGNFYNKTVSIPRDISWLKYNFVAEDKTGTQKQSESVILDSIDPYLVCDNTTEIGYTGDRFTFNVTVKDNYKIQNVSIKWWTDLTEEANAQEIFLSEMSSGHYDGSITIPNTADDLNYTINITDRSRNWNLTTVQNINILDNDAPRIEDISNMELKTGKYYNVTPRASDNREGVKAVYLNYSIMSVEGYEQYFYAQAGGDNTVSVPLWKNSTQFSYQIAAVDEVGNWNITNESILNVTDVISPEFVIDPIDSPITGQNFTMNLTVKENIALSGLHGRYWTDVSSKTNLSINKISSSRYKVTAKIPVNAETFDYNLSGMDSSGNIDLAEGRLEVRDGLLPSIEDYTKDNGTTGDNLTFRVSATDNIDVSNVLLGYRYAEGNFTKINFSHKNDSLWQKQISIRSDFQGNLSYWVKVVDEVGNENKSEMRNITILDNDPPILYAKNITTARVNAGEKLTFNINVSDNIDVSNVRLGYRYVEGNFTKINFSHKNDNLWTGQISINSDFLGTLSYWVKAVDEEGNENKSEMRNITILDNILPDAKAGLDKTIDEDTIVSFDASRSSDNGVIVNYTWTIEDNEFYGQTVSHTFDQPGDYNITLKVMDGGGNSETDTVEVSVNDVTDPTAKAGEDKTIQLGQSITFNGSDSSDNVGIDNYKWEIENKIRRGKEMTYTFNNLGDYELKLTVKDEAGNLDTDTIKITVEESEDDQNYDRQDTDGDGIPDRYEKSHRLDPNDPSDANEDADGDGFSNVYEYQAGTDPFDKSEKPKESSWSILLIPGLIILGILVYSLFENKEKGSTKDLAQKKKDNYRKLEKK